MKTETPKTIHLKDYQAPDFEISDVFLTFDLHDTQTKVTNVMKMRKLTQGASLNLNGEELEFISASINGEKLDDSKYKIENNFLTIHETPDNFELTIENIINPEANKALDGLYKSGIIFCTQNEPEGFRRITYYLDRPDVMAKFTTKIVADKSKYPVLLSNGNPVDSGDLDDGKHFATWEDPFKKPCYLYALVAGDLGLVHDTFKTRSGREIDLRIYVDKGNEDKCDHAMESLKKSMKWDEERFDLEYDLDIYMIVAVDSFNMGAMENKGLNIFNSAYVLAKPETATDQNFLGIEGVIGHEYFHNWTGNRVTCRDWFQLTLKEGLTVFRDQEFSADMNSKVVQRIQDVLRLRQFQFTEDAGPTSHPIKPDHYIEINNFYTATVYEKGAEVIRMIHTFLGEEGFQAGMTKYFELYDGMAVTTEDFIHSMSIANNNFDFEQFKRWYSQSGTPEVHVHYQYDPMAKTLKLDIEQSCPPTPNQDHKLPYHFPFALGLIGEDGKEIPLNLKEAQSDQKFIERGFLNITKEKETFVFEGVSSKPVLSLNRNFSAPVHVHAPLTTADWCFLLANDSDEFNRFEASQVLATRMVNHLLEQKHKGESYNVEVNYLNAYEEFLKDETLDPNVKAMALTIPSEKMLHQGHKPVDIEGIHEVRKYLMKTLATNFEGLFHELYEKSMIHGPYQLDTKSMGLRALKNVAMIFLGELKTQKTNDLAYNQFKNATNMTDEIAALDVLANIDCDQRVQALNEFYERWKSETLVMQKWLSVQANSELPNAYDDVQRLEKIDVYDQTVPNLFRSLMRGFTGNYIHFHHESGRGYKLVADKVIEMDKINPQMAAGLSYAFMEYAKLTDAKKSLMKVELERVINTEGLSKNTYEIISKILK